MNNLSDQQLLRDYLSNRSEAAFAQLVRRHIDFVYSAALRLVRDRQSAEDVVQGVFLALAQNAARLARHPVLSGWLHCTARNIAANTVRASVRRTAREQESAAMNELLAAGSNALWENIAPHLDAALGELAEADRDALLLRYFGRKSAREMAQILGTSEEAAQKRVNRAIERLRELLSKHGITIGAAGLVVAISANAVQSAPVALTISTIAVLAGTGVQSSTAVVAAKAIAMTTTQKTLFGILVAAALAAPVLTYYHVESKLRTQQANFQRAAQRLAQLENARLSGPAGQDNARAPSDDAQLEELLKLRGKVTSLQSRILELSNANTNRPLSHDETLASMRQLYSDRVQWLKDLFVANPSQQVPELQYVDNDRWLFLVQNDRVFNNPDHSLLLSEARTWAQADFANKTLIPALKKFRENGQSPFPTDVSQLAAYFTSPVDDKALQDWTILPANSFSTMKIPGPWVITQKHAVNATLDQRLVLSIPGVVLFGMWPTNEWLVSH